MYKNVNLNNFLLLFTINYHPPAGFSPQEARPASSIESRFSTSTYFKN